MSRARRVKHKGGKCGQTGKVMFKTEQGAINRGAELFNCFQVYRCPLCGSWHLSTKHV